MFGNNPSKAKKKRPFRFILNLVTIISCLMGCLKLAMWHVISPETVAWVMIGVVAAVAIGSPLAKLFITGVAVFLLLWNYAGVNNAAFYLLLREFLVLVVILIGIYIMFSSLRKK